MSLTLYGHPFSSYCQKVFIALDLNETPFDLRILEDKVALAEFSALWPLKRMPALVDGDKTVVESTVIIEYLDVHHRGRVRLVPEDPAAALDVRMLDRFFDSYIMTPMQNIVLNQLRPVEAMASRKRVACSTRPMAGLRRISRDGRGRPVAISPWPIVPPRPACSMPIGRMKSRRILRRCGPIVRACSSIPPSNRLSMAGGRIAPTFRWERRTEIKSLIVIARSAATKQSMGAW